MKFVSIAAGTVAAVIVGAGIAPGAIAGGRTHYYVGGPVCLTVTGNWVMGTIDRNLIDGPLRKGRGRTFHVNHQETTIKFVRDGARVWPYYGEGGVIKTRKVTGEKYRAMGCGETGTETGR